MAALAEPRNALPRIPERRLDSIGKNQRYLKQIATLPVSSTLLQNVDSDGLAKIGFDYQSVRHCSKTELLIAATAPGLITSQFDTAPKPGVQRRRRGKLFDYQSVRHCSKTSRRGTGADARFDYQSVRHCSKTRSRLLPYRAQFDYQSVRHCSKTRLPRSTESPEFDYQSVRHCSKTPFVT